MYLAESLEMFIKSIGKKVKASGDNYNYVDKKTGLRYLLDTHIYLVFASRILLIHYCAYYLLDPISALVILKNTTTIPPLLVTLSCDNNIIL